MEEDEVWELTVAEFDKHLDSLETRELQKEAARAISTMPADNKSIHKFNKDAHHNSWMWYKAVIKHYVYEYGGMPSEVGPGKDVKFVLDE